MTLFSDTCEAYKKYEGLNLKTCIISSDDITPILNYYWIY